MYIISYFSILISYNFPFCFPFRVYLEFHYNLCILGYSPIWNVIIIIYIKIFRLKNFHEIFFEISCFQSVPAGRALLESENHHFHHSYSHFLSRDAQTFFFQNQTNLVISTLINMRIFFRE